jgi:hypothetical protein
MVVAVSFCLYGPENPLYYTGLLQNIYLVGRYFPNWVVYAFLGSDVTEGMRMTLASIPYVRVRDTGICGPLNMIHRFYAIDEEDVEVMFSRDADSRLHWKDRWAIRQFLDQPRYIGHMIRDNPSHNVAMMGGLWGIRKSAGINVHAEYVEFCSHPRDHGAGYDQSFLAERIYPKIFDRMLAHHSYGLAYKGEVGVEFPFSWTQEVFCGRPEIPTDYIERPEPQQELRLKQANTKLFIKRDV